MTYCRGLLQSDCADFVLESSSMVLSMVSNLVDLHHLILELTRVITCRFCTHKYT